MKNLLLLTSIGLGLFYSKTIILLAKLKHFKLSEFRGEHNKLSLDLLLKLDKFRDILGETVIVSPAEGAMVRDVSDRNSQHLYGRAIDVMLPNTTDFRKAFEVAKSVGFTGIGFYPHWKPYIGFHLDVRPQDYVSKWAGINPDGDGQKYVGIEDGFSYV